MRLVFVLPRNQWTLKPKSFFFSSENCMENGPLNTYFRTFSPEFRRQREAIRRNPLGTYWLNHSWGAMRWAVVGTTSLVPLNKAQAQTSTLEMLYLKVNKYYFNPGLAEKKNKTTRSSKPCMGEWMCVRVPARGHRVTTKTNDCWQQAVASDCVNGECKNEV